MNLGDVRYWSEVANFLQQTDPRLMFEVVLMAGLYIVWRNKDEVISTLKGQVDQLKTSGRQKDRTLSQLESKVKLLENQLSRSNLENKYELSEFKESATTLGEPGEQVVKPVKAKDRRRGNSQAS